MCWSLRNIYIYIYIFAIMWEGGFTCYGPSSVAVDYLVFQHRVCLPVVAAKQVFVGLSLPVVGERWRVCAYFQGRYFRCKSIRWPEGGHGMISDTLDCVVSITPVFFFSFLFCQIVFRRQYMMPQMVPRGPRGPIPAYGGRGNYPMPAYATAGQVQIECQTNSVHI